METAIVLYSRSTTLAAKLVPCGCRHVRYKIAGFGKLSWSLSAQKEESKSGHDEAEECTNDLQGGYDTQISISNIRHSPRPHGKGQGGSQATKPLLAAQDTLRLHSGRHLAALRSWDSRGNQTNGTLPHLAVPWRESLFFLAFQRELIVFDCALYLRFVSWV